MSFGLFGHQFQFQYLGKTHFAVISFEALQDCFGGVGRPPADVYIANAAAINSKAIEILDSGAVRSPFVLTTRDFQSP
jgi:hypothetical protein